MAQKTPITLTEEVESPSECRHHWIIQAAEGPVSPGLCQLCGETREFKNYFEAASWADTRTAGFSRAASRRAVDTSRTIDRQETEEDPVDKGGVEDDQDE